ncbi:MAG: putative pterin-4-alpha-carbinolamine dehydratase [Pseudomonadota bacterium]|jgi:4a-hydroxytetrahydrobiopterin dehydratase
MHSLDSSALQEALAGLPQWTCDPVRPALVRRFVFADFAQAFAFMAEMAIRSEKQDHHPEWFNVHRLVDVTLTTHDAGGISERDITWARAADAAFARHLSPTFQAGA